MQTINYCNTLKLSALNITPIAEIQQKAPEPNQRNKLSSQPPGFNEVFQSLNPRTETFFLDLEETPPPFNTIQKPAELSIPL